MCLYIDNILVSYANEKREEYGRPEMPLIVITDVCSADCTEDVKAKLHCNNMKLFYVPATCTGMLCGSSLSLVVLNSTVLLTLFCIM